MPGSRLPLAQMATSQPQAAPAASQNPATTSSTVTTASPTTTAAAHKNTAAADRRHVRARIQARRQAQRRALLAQQSQAQTVHTVPLPTKPAAAGSSATEQDPFLVQQQEQAARLTREQQQVLHAYTKAQRQMQEEPRIQDSLGDQPPPYAPVIPPHAASQDTQGIQEAPGPAQTTPKLVPPSSQPTQPPPSSQPNQAPPAPQPQSEPPQ
jgi:hypothetical protein